MADLLVRLYDLPELAPALARSREAGVRIRRPEVWEKALLTDWVTQTFIRGWSLEAEASFTQHPPRSFIAIAGSGAASTLVGFACHDCSRPNFFGPTGVADAWRGKGVGSALLLACLHAMRDAGYAYAIIGGVGPAAFYQRAVDAIAIEGSSPGIYDLSLVRKPLP